MPTRPKMQVQAGPIPLLRNLGDSSGVPPQRLPSLWRTVTEKPRDRVSWGDLSRASMALPRLPPCKEI